MVRHAIVPIALLVTLLFVQLLLSFAFGDGRAAVDALALVVIGAMMGLARSSRFLWAVWVVVCALIMVVAVCFCYVWATSLIWIGPPEGSFTGTVVLGICALVAAELLAHDRLHLNQSAECSTAEG